MLQAIPFSLLSAACLKSKQSSIRLLHLLIPQRGSRYEASSVISKAAVTGQKLFSWIISKMKPLSEVSLQAINSRWLWIRTQVLQAKLIIIFILHLEKYKTLGLSSGSSYVHMAPAEASTFTSRFGIWPLMLLLCCPVCCWDPCPPDAALWLCCSVKLIPKWQITSTQLADAGWWHICPPLY